MDVIKKSKDDKNLLEKVKQLMKGQLAFEFETPARVLNSAAIDIAFLNFPRDHKEILKEIELTTIQDISKAVDKYLKPEMFLTTMIVPNSLSPNAN